MSGMVILHRQNVDQDLPSTKWVSSGMIDKVSIMLSCVRPMGSNAIPASGMMTNISLPSLIGTGSFRRFGVGDVNGFDLRFGMKSRLSHGSSTAKTRRYHVADHKPLNNRNAKRKPAVAARFSHEPVNFLGDKFGLAVIHFIWGDFVLQKANPPSVPALRRVLTETTKGPSNGY